MILAWANPFKYESIIQDYIINGHILEKKIT